MRYHVWRFDYSGYRRCFDTRLLFDNKDRVESMTVPSPMGFYHFPETESPEIAFRKLVQCLKTEASYVARDFQYFMDLLDNLKVPKCKYFIDTHGDYKGPYDLDFEFEDKVVEWITIGE